MTNNSTYLWVLPMFHAAGWTFPWASTFAFSTQVPLHRLPHRTTHSSPTLLPANHQDRQLSQHLETLPPLRRNALLRRSHRSNRHRQRPFGTPTTTRDQSNHSRCSTHGQPSGRARAEGHHSRARLWADRWAASMPWTESNSTYGFGYMSRTAPCNSAKGCVAAGESRPGKQNIRRYARTSEGRMELAMRKDTTNVSCTDADVPKQD